MGLIVSLDGKKVVRDKMTLQNIVLNDSKESQGKCEQLGTELAQVLLRNGGEEIVKSFRNTV